MPRDDYDKYNRRDKGRQVLRELEFEKRAKQKPRPKKKPGKIDRFIPEYTASTLPPFRDRPPAIFLKPPYAEVHPVPPDIRSAASSR